MSYQFTQLYHDEIGKFNFDKVMTTLKILFEDYVPTSSIQIVSTTGVQINLLIIMQFVQSEFASIGRT